MLIFSPHTFAYKDSGELKNIISEKKKITKLRKKIKGDFRIKIEDTLAGEETSLLYQRLRLNYQDWLSWGELTERDKGEKEFADLCKKYISFKNKHCKLILGNYAVSFGEGLVIKNCWTKSKQGIAEDVTTKENFLFAGGALKTFLGNWDSTIFYSKDKMDAQYEEEEVKYISVGEDALEDELAEELMGGNINYHFNHQSSLGASWYKGEYSPKTYPSLGWKKEVYGLNLKTNIKDIKLSGEFAQVKNAGKGLIVRIETKIKDFEFLGLLRNYEEDFDNPRSAGFANADGEDDDKDEVGAYLQMKYKINPNWKIYTYYDQWKHPSDLTTDNEMKVKIKHRLNSRLKTTGSMKWKDEDINREKGQRITSIAQLDWFPTLHNHFSFLYYHLQKDVSKYANTMQIDNYIYGKAVFRFTKRMSLEGRIKFKDIDAKEKGGETTEYYIQLKNKFFQHGEILAKYTNVSKVEEEPEHKIKMQIDLRL